MVRLIIGLGNPGRDYDGTRHNVGFRVADALAKKWGVEYKSRRKFAAQVAEAKRGETMLVLAKPVTYMNLSGQAATALRAWHKCEPRDVIVLFDDADLGLGQLRVRGSGSSGGHRGMQSVIESLGTNEVPRVRLGIGRSEGTRAGLVDHVLHRFDAGEEKLVAAMTQRAVEAVECILARGLSVAMNDFNKRTEETE